MHKVLAIAQYKPFFIEVVAQDTDRGCRTLTKLYRKGFHGFGQDKELGFGAGMGLPNMMKFTDTFEIDSIVGKGTKVRMAINLQQH